MIPLFFRDAQPPRTARRGPTFGNGLQALKMAGEVRA